MKKYILLIIIVLHSCFLQSRSLEEIKRSGVIYIAFTESGLKTVNYQFAQEFARFLNVRLEIVPIIWNETFSINGIVPPDYITNPDITYKPDALKKADLICGTIYVFDWREKFFDYAGIMSVSDLLIVRKSKKKRSLLHELIIPEKYRDNKPIDIKDYNDLKGLRIAFLQNSSYETNIKQINERIGGGIQFVETKSEDESQQLLKEGKVDGFIAVSYVALEFLNNNPQHRLAFPVSKPQNVGWAVENENTQLGKEIENFFATIEGKGKLNDLFKNEFGVNYETYLEIINSYAESSNSSTRDLDEILKEGKLIVALRDRDMIYHPQGKKQFNNYLAEEFAKYLGVDLEITITPEFSDYFKTDNGNIIKDSAYMPQRFNDFDVACDLFVPLDWRLNKIDIIDFVPGAMVVVAKKDVSIKSINDLKKYKGVTSEGSTYEEALMKNNVTDYYYKQGNEFFNEVLNGNADYTIVSFNVYALPDFPELEAKFVLGEINRSGWGIKKNQPKLRQKILEFLEYAKYTDILDEYFFLQTGIPFKAADNYLNTLHQTYQSGIFPFVFYGTDEGLPQEDILSIFQDQEGFMWFGTQAGAIKYNGREMKVFTTKQGLASNIVFDIKQDSLGKIYFATLNGITILRNGRFKDEFNGIGFKDIYIDNENNKWFYGDNGIYQITKDDVEKEMNKLIPALPFNVHSIIQNNDNKFYLIAASTGLYMLDKDQNLTKLNDYYCKYIFIDEDENVWLSTSKGIYSAPLDDFIENKKHEIINERVNIPKQAFVHFITQNRDGSIWLMSDFEAYQIFTLNQNAIKYNQNIGLKKLRILSFLEDNEDNFWFGFSGGIQKLTNRSLRILFPNQLENSLNNFDEDINGRIWLAFNNGIYYYQDELVNLSQFFDGESIPYAVQVLPNNKIIVASTKAIYLLDNNTLEIEKEYRFVNPLFHLKSIYISKNNEIFLMTGSDGILYYMKRFDSEPIGIENSSSSLIYTLINYENEIIGGNNTGLVSFNGTTFEKLRDFDSPVWTMCELDSILYVGTEDGLATYYNDEINMLEILNLPNNVINAIIPAEQKGYLWLGTNKGFCYYNINTNKIELTIDAKDGLPGNEISVNGLLINEKGMLWIATFHGISTFDVKKVKTEKFVPECRIERIILNGKEVNTLNKELKYNENNLAFELTGLSFKDEESLEYDFFLKGLENDYGASVGKQHRANYQNLSPGDYEFVYRAKGKDNIWSYYDSIKFTILKPYWLEWWFILSVAVVFFVIVFSIIKLRERTLRKRNEHLEKLVKERTFEIERQKNAIEQKNTELEQQQEEIMAQRDSIEQKNLELEQQKEEILAQKDELQIQKNIATEQRDEIAKHQKETMDSIIYARQIQNAIMPPYKVIENSYSDFFIVNKPRDIVSGDFYWFKELNNYAVFVAADCTGHGVPGAFMSMLGTAFLNEIVIKHNENLDAGTILDDLRFHVVDSLHQTGRIDEAKDGMDIAITIVNLDNFKMQFAGAFNPLYLIRNNELIEYKANRMPIGIFEKMERKFTTHNIQLQKNDLFYIFSDGYASQFGGKKGKKFMSSRMKKLLLSIQEKSMEQQKEVLIEKIENWMGGLHEQVDDILVIGVKI